TFISGMVNEPGAKRTAPASLLHRIGSDGILVIADFSTYATISPKQQAMVMAQLRRIYDGHFSREFGTPNDPDNKREWHGRLTVIAGGTPDVDRQRLMNQSLGERLIRKRWQRA